MKSFKRLVVFMLVLSMVIGTMVPAFAFSDVEDTYYEDEINKLAAVGVVTGDPEGTFRPEDNITRAEVAVIICKMLGAGNTMDAQKNMPSKFSDVATGEWYTGAVNLATDIGVIAGFPDGTFRPNDNITVAQAVTLMVNALGRKVYVEKAGEWPANYIAEGAKLGVTKNVVAGAQDDLATRGVVSAMAWNSLDIPVWDVYETTHAGEIVSSATETMLVKYFKDYVTEIKTVGYGKEGGELKWAEDVVVKANHHTLNTIAEGQILVDMADILDDVATFEAKTKNRVKDEDKATYSINDAKQLVVYVADANVSTTELLNKKVDIMFGKDNVATLVIVTDEVEDDMLTKYLKDDNKIVVGSEEYKLAEKVEMSINYNKLTETDPHKAIDAIIKAVGLEVNDKTITKAIKVNVTLNDNDKVEKIAFFVSGNLEIAGLTTAPIVVNQAIVEEIDDDEIIVLTASSDSEDIDIEKLEEADDVITVLKDGEEVTLRDIAAGDVITYTGDIYDEATIIFVSSAKVTGTADRIKKSLEMTVDGTTYFANADLIGDLSKDIETAKAFDEEDLNNVVEEEVELYLNFLGEYVAVLADTEGGEWTFGIVKDVKEYDEEEYTQLKIRVLTEKGENKTYYVTEEDKDVKEDKTFATSDAPTTASEVLAEKDFIAFQVTGENKIDVEDIIIIDTENEDEAGFVKVNNEAYKVVAGPAAAYDYDEKTIDEREFNADTVIFNLGKGNDTVGEDTVEIASAGFDAIASKTEIILDGESWIVYDENDDIKFVVVSGKVDYANSDADYAYVMNIDVAKDEAYKVTLYVEGEEFTYLTKGEAADLAFAENDFITYSITGSGKLDLTASAAVLKVEDIAELEITENLAGTYVADYLVDTYATAYLTKKEITVAEVATAIKFKEIDGVRVDSAKVEKDDGKFDGIIYDLTDLEAPAMVSDLADVDGKVVFAIDTDATPNNKADIIVIVKR